MTQFTELTPLPRIKAQLDAQFGRGTWSTWEPETISLDTGIPLTPLLVDKLSLLRIIENQPRLVYEDPALFLYASEVINNTTANFESVPYLTILEAGYSVFTINALRAALGIKEPPPEALVKTVTYILNMEGASEPVPPLTFVNPKDLSPGQLPEDIRAKNKAMAEYLKHMESL